MTGTGGIRIGLAYGSVEVVAYDPGWAAVAATHQAVIAAALSGQVLAVEHVGSTAVVGLPAKPIVDLAVRLAPEADPEAVIDAVTAAGYLFRGDKGDHGGLLFVAEPEPGLRTVHVHVIADGDPQWDRYLAVRDRLAAQPDTAARYADLKTRLAAQHPGDRAAYTAAKHSFLTQLLADLPTATTTRVVQRVRALLITPTGKLLTIRRTKPRHDTYWVLPGGGIEPSDASLEDAAHREITEEVGSRAVLHRLVHVTTVAGHRHAIFAGRIDQWDPAARTGPELADPANGSYDLDELDLDPDLLGDGRIWPVPTLRWLAGLIRDGRDLFTVPDLRQAGPIAWRSRRAPQPWTGPIPIVTGSDAKFAIARDHCAPHGLTLAHIRLDLTEIQSIDVAAVAAHKAEQAYAQLGRPVIVEDSGFGLDELAGYPGALVKHLIHAAGAHGMTCLAGLTTTRACTLTAVLAYTDSQGTVTFTHTETGTVATAPAGQSDRLPLWTVYIPPGATAPLAAMPESDLGAWHTQWQQQSVFAQFARWYAQHNPPTVKP